jgi:hypothetical protein
MGKFITSALVAGVMALGLGGHTGDVGRTHASIRIQGPNVTVLWAAAAGAAQCGGYVLIDKADGEILVAGCDR